MALSFPRHGNPPPIGNTRQDGPPVTNLKPSVAGKSVAQGVLSRIKGVRSRMPKMPTRKEMALADTPKKRAALARKYKMTGAAAAALLKGARG